MFAPRKYSFLFSALLLLAGLFAATSASIFAQEASEVIKDPHHMSEEEILSFVEKFNSIFDGPSLEVIDEIFAPDYVGHLPLAPMLDRDGLKAYIASFYDAISDLTEEVNEVIISEDRVVIHVTYSGTHDGPLFGIPATGNPVAMDGIGIFRFDENGLVAENWAIIDVVGLLAQVGAFPPQA